MPASSDAGEVSGVPVNFYCEPATGKTRVYALIRLAGRVPVLKAVLTSADSLLAHRAALVLTAAATDGPSVALDTRIAELRDLLPHAPAASLGQAVAWAYAQRWPVAAELMPSWRAVSDDDGEAMESADGGDADSGFAGRVPAPGRVVRVTRTVEVRVRDEARVLTAARAAGWTPAPVEERSADDPDDVLGAVFWLADEELEVVGAVVESQSGAAEPVQPLSSGGVGLELSEAELPDFAALFPLDPEASEDDWQLTPRTADALYSALCLVADEAYDDVEEHGDAPITERGSGEWNVLDRLPRLSWRQPAGWRRQVARAADDLCGDLETGDWPIPRCNAEELCLHLAIEDGEACAEIAKEAGGQHVDLPERRDDYDWEGCSQMFFQDHDILLLDQPEFDGIENPDDEVNRRLGMGDLRPGNWFATFSNVEARNPDRGYRR